jgi:PAS domain S-box-containing protein
MEQSAPVKEHGFFYNLWEEFVYSGNKNITDHFVLRQLTFINTFSILGFLSVVSFGLLHVLGGNYHSGIPELTGGAVFALNLLLFRISKNMNLAKVIMLTTQGTLLIVQLATGGIAHTGIYWYFTFPIVAFFLMGLFNGTIWIGLLYVTTLAVLTLGHLGEVTIVYTLTEIRQLLISLFIVSALLYIYRNTIEKTEVMLRQQTEQLKITKRAIEQAKAEDEAILANLGEGMITMGTSGNIFLINNVALKMLKLEEQKTVGQSINNSFPLKDSNGNNIVEENRPWYKAKTSGENVSGEYIFVRSDKSEVPVSLVTTPIILNGETIGVIELFRDITEEKRLDKTKSEFVALASHQLRTPISAISWFTEMLLHGDAGAINQEQKEHLAQIYESNRRMAALVDALLNVSRLEMGNFSVKPIATDLAAFTHNILAEEIGKQETPKKLEVKEIYDPKVGSISIDEDLMKIILQNLFTNCIKYTPENGVITVSILPSGQAVQNGGNNKEDGILIVIADTGYGIPKTQADKIFTKLFRADNIKAKDTDGTGLGLYIVKSIVDTVGGKIWFSSEENKGTTFYIFLPKEGMKEKSGEKKLTPAKNE